MNRVFIQQISSKLSTGMIDGYKAGLTSIVENNRRVLKQKAARRSRRAVRFAAGSTDPLLNARYTGADKDALRHFLMEAFEMAGVGSWELEEKLKELGVKVQSDVLHYDEFELETRKLMSNYGIGIGEQPPAGWIKQALDTAIKESIHAARWQRINDPDVTDLYPALMYKTQEDDAVRPEHEELADNVYMKDDPIWDIIYPQNDHGCRCYTDPVSIYEIGDVNVLSSTPEFIDSVKKDIPEEFQRNAGKSESIWRKWLDQKYKDMPADEVEKLKEMLRQYGEGLTL